MRQLFGKKECGQSLVRNFILLFLLAFFIVISSSKASAVGLAVNKAVMEFPDILKGGYGEDIVYISTDADMDIPVDFEVIGDIKGWVSFEPDTTSDPAPYVSRDHVQPVKIIIRPPADMPAGRYSGGVRIITGTINRPEGPYGSQLQAAFLIRIYVNVTGTERLSCNVGGINIPDTELGSPLEYSMTVSNDGNVRVDPSVSLDIWNQDQTKLVSTQELDLGDVQVFPTTSQVLTDRFENKLRVGQYWAYATIEPCDKSELISFSVLEKGAIADSAELVRIENGAWAKIGEPVAITGIFKNTGSRTVSAKLKGTITFDEKIVQVIDSDFYDVAPGETANITVYFTPKKLGRYYISGRALYNNKLTFEKSSILTVNEGVEEQSATMVYALVIILIVIVLLVLLISIKRKRQRLHRI